jgi:hypothetical protein
MCRNDSWDGLIREVTYLDRVQAVLLLHIILILATIQESALKSECTCKKHSYFSLIFYIDASMNIMIDEPLSCRTYDLL